MLVMGSALASMVLFRLILLDYQEFRNQCDKIKSHTHQL